ncbi:MAG TPA: glycoside hydrolase family 3 C-terminal domain-containing protein [Polyangiaceae bacterium]|nr:glycoside hydrolase family 3 C-terminal domain-containing protein [Polyangiaceae bacterium]
MRTPLLAIGFSWTLFGTGCGSSEPSLPEFDPPPASETPDARAAEVISHMTRREKIELVHGGAARDWPVNPPPRGGNGYYQGNSRLHIPALYMADGSVGVGNRTGPATALPSCMANAASWDLEQARQYGEVLGRELRAHRMNVNLGGNVNLSGREPRGGRTFETKGEDPILAGKVTAAHLRAIQAENVIATVKHFALNDQETGRTLVDVLIDERSARETDLLAFEVAIKDSDAQSVMCSYNLVNGQYACENADLLNGVLKTDWQFQGFVMSDWDATHSTATAANNGLDQEQPEDLYFGSSLDFAVQSGGVSEARLDEMVQRILRAMFAVGLFEVGQSTVTIDEEAHASLAREFAEQGSVLLKNEGILPLDSAVGAVAIIGSHADMGVLSGGGSAQVYPLGGAALREGSPSPPGWAEVIWDPSSPLAALKAKLPLAQLSFDAGVDPASAAALAAKAEVAIVFMSQWESEGMDVPRLNFTDLIHSSPIDQDAIVSAVARANPRTIVVLENGGPKAMPWLEDVSAVLEAWYPGQRGGEAIANILVGDVNPSGKLPITFPAREGDLPRPTSPTAIDLQKRVLDYGIEGVNVGYKWYEQQGIRPLFPFGYGLSYTTFSLENAELAVNRTEGDLGLAVTCEVQNTGTRRGAEVAQVYVKLPESTGEGTRLIGWQKVWVEAGATRTASISVSGNDSSHPLSYWDVEAHAWRNAPGTYTVYLGNASDRLVKVGSFEL